MKWISTTIKRHWLNQILKGKKTELKVATDFWRKRLEPLMGETDVAINFLCGRETAKYRVVDISYNKRGLKFPPKIIDGTPTYAWFEIELGERIE